MVGTENRYMKKVWKAYKSLKNSTNMMGLQELIPMHESALAEGCKTTAVIATSFQAIPLTPINVSKYMEDL